MVVLREEAVAAELAALRIDWKETDPEKVLGGRLTKGRCRYSCASSRSSPAGRAVYGRPFSGVPAAAVY